MKSLLSSITCLFLLFATPAKSDNVHQKEGVTQIVSEWIPEVAEQTPNDSIRALLHSTTDWGTFKSAMEEGERLKLDDLFSILNSRLGDFNAFEWPTTDGVIAETMIRVSKSHHIGRIKELLSTEDDWVKLWSSLHLVTHDTSSFEMAFETLKQVLDSGDGISFYPRAIPVFIQSNNPRLLQLSEGIFANVNEDDPFFLMMNEEVLRRLLLAENHRTLDFLISGLSDFQIDPRANSTDDNGNEIAVLKCDRYIDVVNSWRLDRYRYQYDWSPKKKKQYAKKLIKWLNTQFDHISKQVDHQINTTFNGSTMPFFGVSRFDG